MATADQMERERRARATAGLPPAEIGSGGRPQGTSPSGAYSPTLKEQLDKVDWVGLGKIMGINQGSGGPSTPAASTPATSTPSDSGGGSSGGGGGRREPQQNTEQTSKMYADALKELMRQYGVSQENILASIARMESDPYNQANAYEDMRLSAARVAADPLAEYMAAAGMSGGQSAASQQMAQAEADAYLKAMRNVQNIMSSSQEQANASRMADIGLIRTGATQDLESNLNMLRLGLERERLGALTGLQQRNLENEMAMRNAITQSISSIFAGQNVAPESILKLIESALAKMNTNRWATIPTPGV